MLNTLFTYAALIGGTVLVFQFVLMLLGISDEGGHGASADGADLSGGVDTAGGPDWHEAADADLAHPEAPWFYEVLSLRTLSAAATFFGLAGKTSMAYEFSPLRSFVFAALAGVAAMYVVYWIFRQIYKLQHSGNENLRNSIGRPATVYVPIPGSRAGTGKVTFRMQNRLVEYQAVTDDETRLATGEKVVVIAIVNSDTVRVARAASPAPEMAVTNTTT
jgi:hypothetical protein